VVVDGAGDIVWVMWQADGVVDGGGRCSQHHLGDVARVECCGWWWMALATSFG